MDGSPLASIIGTAAALCSMTSFAPQIAKIWKERDASSVSLRMYVVTVTGFVLWTIYGWLIESWPVIGANTVCLAMSATVLALKWRFSREAGGEAADQAPSKSDIRAL